MYNNKISLGFSLILISWSLIGCNDDKDQSQHPHDVAQAQQKPPNVLFIMADDLGYSDLGAFGGEIHTPNLDALANQGKILTDYHTAPTCSPTRSQLISGTDHHLAGIGAMAELSPAHLKGQPGYEGYLNERSLSIADVLRNNGYRTYISGKWHLGLTPDTNAHAKGFDRSFTLLQGVDLHFKNTPNRYKRIANYTEDGKEVSFSELPADFFSTDYYTDKLLQYFDKDQNSNKPFFAFAAYTAPHWPIQAPQAFSDKYKGKYDVGYDVIRNNRIARQKQLGIIPVNFNPAQPLETANIPNYPTWDNLSPEQKAFEARKMEIYAGMVENLDHNVGRIIQYLKDHGQYDNTLIFFVSDNGAEGFLLNSVDETVFDQSLAAIGTDQSFHYVGPRWAEVSAAPFHLWKATAGEGATTSPAIVKLPNQKQAKEKYHGFASVLDILPTVLDFAKVSVPKDQYNGRAINNPSGVSWKNALENKHARIRPADFSFADELHGNKYAKQGDWKIALQTKAKITTGAWTLGPDQWELYNLKNDRGETTNLAAQNPEKLKQLIQVYQQYALKNGVQEYAPK